MKVEEIWTEIKLKSEQFRKGLESNEKKIEKFEKNLVKGFGIVTGAATAMGYALIRIGGDLLKSYNAQEVAITKLEAGMKNVTTAGEGATQMLIEQAKALQKITAYSDEEIINAQAMLSTFQLNERQISAIIPRLLDMAAGVQKLTGQEVDLQQIAVALGKGFTGQVGLLGRYGVVLDENAIKAEGFNGILKSLDNNFKGMAESVGNTTQGAMQRFKNMLGDIKEEMGARIAPIIKSYTESMTDAFGIIMKYIDILVPELGVLGDAQISATQKGVVLAQATTKGIFMMARAWTRLKIVFWTVAGSFSKFAEIILFQHRIMHEGIYRAVRGIAYVYDKVFGTDVASSLDKNQERLREWYASYGEFSKLAFSNAEEEIGNLLRQEDAEIAVMDEWLEKSEEKLEMYGDLTGALNALNQAKKEGGSGDKDAKKTEGDMIPIREKAIDLLHGVSMKEQQVFADQKSLIESTYDYQDAVKELGRTLVSQFARGEMSVGSFLKTFAKLGIQFAGAQLLGGGFLGGMFGLLGGLFEKGGLIFPPQAQEGLIVTNRRIQTPAGAGAGEKGRPEVIAPYDKFLDTLKAFQPVVQVLEASRYTKVKSMVDFDDQDLDEIGRDLIERLEERDIATG